MENNGNIVNIVNTKKSNLLKDKYPEIFACIFMELNNSYTYEEINNLTCGSKKLINWRCPDDSSHTWYGSIANTTKNKNFCKQCKKPCPKTTIIKENNITVNTNDINDINDIKCKSKFLRDIHPNMFKCIYKNKNIGKYTEEELYNITCLSGKLIWWICPNNYDHQWEQQVSGLTRNKYFCKKCRKSCPEVIDTSNYVMSVENTVNKIESNLLREKRPDLYNCIIIERNNGKYTNEEIYNLTCGSDKIFWWRCPKNPDHIWEQSVSNITNNVNICKQCPKVMTQTMIENEKNFIKDIRPDLYKCIYREKNKDEYSDDELNYLTCGSNKIIWWKCNVNPNHVWKQMVNSIINSINICQFCSKNTHGNINININTMKIAETSSNFLRDKHPEIFKCIYKEKNIDKYSELELYNLKCGSDKIITWTCNVDSNHSWEKSVYDSTRSKFSCPHCFKPVTRTSKNKVKNIKTGNYQYSEIFLRKYGDIPKDLNSRLLKDRYPEVFSQILRTNHTTPLLGIVQNNYTEEEINKLSYGSGQNLWWKCESNICGCHIWESTVDERVGCYKNGTICPFCDTRKICPHTSIMSIPMLANEFYHELNPGINPYTISHGSNIPIKWKCSNHKTCEEHIWVVSSHSRTNTVSSCPYCTHHENHVCPCDTFMNNPILALEFDHNNNHGIIPNNLSNGSEQLINWKCSLCSSLWNSMIYIRTKKVESGCPKCVLKKSGSKPERMCLEQLELLNIQPLLQTNLHYIPTKRYDFLFNNNNIIEMDGLQHFKFTEHWHKTDKKFKENQNVDKIKTIIPYINGYSILRISNDNSNHIKMCIDHYNYLKSSPEYCNTPIIVVDDLTKYSHLFENITNEIILENCDKDYYDEIVILLKNAEINMVDIKTNSLNKIRFPLLRYTTSI